MNGQNLQRLMKSELNGKAFALLTLLIFLAGGSMLSFIGYGIGVLGALQFGFLAPFGYGGATGYEGAVLFGGMVGSAVLTMPLILIWLRGRSIMMRWSMIAYAILWFLVVIVMHYAAVATGGVVFSLLPIPAVVVGLAISIAIYLGEG